MKNLIQIILIFILAVSTSVIYGQNMKFTLQDTLRGTITRERIWWDLSYYHLSVRVNPGDSTLKGQNTIRYKVLSPFQRMQIDLQEPMQILKVSQDGKLLDFKRDGNAYFIDLSKKQIAGSFNEINIDFEGKPQVSKRPPWSGGLSWKRDANNNPLIVTTCQGDGASLWWPCKDHQYDEPDSTLIAVTVPDSLTDVSNGRLRNVLNNPDHTKTFNWFVSSPINNYCINLNVGDYVYFGEKYKGEKGMLDCDYYVLSYNLDKAKSQFKEVKRMLDALEYWFGPYPFYEDSYKLVEVPYPGMEHQSSVTYGNDYKNGYKQTDESNTGWGFKFDFIIIHESAHEWFGNSITSKDVADMWIHEAFGAYSESLFLNFHFGKQACSEYVIGTRSKIRNDRPIIGPYNVNTEGSHDMYYKGANMLHTLRQVVDDDEKFRSMMRGLSSTFYHQTVTTNQVEKYMSEVTGMDLSTFFNQYLRDTRIPVFEYKLDRNQLSYRWSNCVDGFNMPIKISAGNIVKWVNPTKDWKQLEIETGSKIETDINFYVDKEDISTKE
ncbi:MAG: M1 family metallopeptidase [Bacteroidales bacterium]|nr:M1 family metallopeptidase [Bacteroidales bacterium]